jgi:hypothetical protein
MYTQASVSVQDLRMLAAQLYRDADKVGALFIREKMRNAARNLDKEANDLLEDALHATQCADI